MINKICLILTLLVSNLYAQEGWNEWAWETDQIPYSRFPTNHVEMYVQYDAATNIIAMYPMSPDITVSDLDGGPWQEEPVLVRAQDMRALDCWYSLKERFQKLGVYSRNAQGSIDLMPFPISFYRSDIENIDALKGLIFELAGTINADVDPYQNGGLDEEGENAYFTSGCWYPMFVNPSMLTSPRDYLGIALETDYEQERFNAQENAYEYPSRYATSGIAVSPWAAQISVSNILTRALLPVHWKNEESVLDPQLHPDSILCRLDPYTMEYEDVFACLASDYCYYPPSAPPPDGTVNPGFPTTTPSFSWSYDSAFRPTDAYIYARTSWVNTTYWYQEPSFQTNEYPIGAYGWDRIRSAIRLFNVVAVPRIRDEVSDEYKIVWTREPINGQYEVTIRDHDCRGYNYTYTETGTVSGLSFPPPEVSRMKVDGPSGFVGWNVQAINGNHIKSSAYANWYSRGAGIDCSREIPGACAYLDTSAYTTPSRIWQHSDVPDNSIISITTNIVSSPRFDTIPDGVVAWFVKPLYSAGVVLRDTSCPTNELVVITTNTLLNVTNFTYVTTAAQSPIQSSDKTYSYASCVVTQGICASGITVEDFSETLQHSVVFQPYILLYAVRDVSEEFAYR